MAFNLEVEFSGLCLYVVDETNAQVGVLMPDARLNTANAHHEDGTAGIPHVGYLRFNLNDLNPVFPVEIDPSRPKYEGVHQFNRETLEFVMGGSVDPIKADNINVPKFEEIAPDLSAPGKSMIKVRDGLFTESQPAQVLMRTILNGGTITGTSEEPWVFGNLFRPGQNGYLGKFAPVVIWKRPVETLSIRFTPFGGGTPIEFPLEPKEGAGGTVRLKVANFCSTNPLEWEEMGRRTIDEDDHDFKWLYRLLAPVNGTSWREALLGGHRFPIPMIPPPELRRTGVEDCIGGQIKGPTT